MKLNRSIISAVVAACLALAGHSFAQSGSTGTGGTGGGPNGGTSGNGAAENTTAAGGTNLGVGSEAKSVAAPIVPDDTRATTNKSSQKTRHRRSHKTQSANKAAAKKESQDKPTNNGSGQ